MKPFFDLKGWCFVDVPSISPKVEDAVVLNEDRFIRFGNWLFDVFQCADDDTLGITVYEQGTDPFNDKGRCVDIFIKKDTLKVISSHA